MREILDRFLGREAPDPDDSAELERLLRARFRFLEERQGFELAGSSTLDDGGAVAAYANRAAGRGVAIFARRTRGVWAGVGRLAANGEVPPVNRETVASGVWREVGRIDVDDQRSLDEALVRVAATLGGTRAA